MQWLIENWRLIIDLISIIVVIVFFFIKKKPVNDLKGLLYDLCVAAVIRAEKSSYKGQEKLGFAVGIVQSLILSRYPDLDFSKYEPFVVSLIENILSTPKKKEENSNEN